MAGVREKRDQRREMVRGMLEGIASTFGEMGVAADLGDGLIIGDDEEVHGDVGAARAEVETGATLWVYEFGRCGVSRDATYVDGHPVEEWLDIEAIGMLAPSATVYSEDDNPFPWWSRSNALIVVRSEAEIEALKGVGKDIVRPAFHFSMLLGEVYGPLQRDIFKLYDLKNEARGRLHVAAEVKGVLSELRQAFRHIAEVEDHPIAARLGLTPEIVKVAEQWEEMHEEASRTQKRASRAAEKAGDKFSKAIQRTWYYAWNGRAK